PGVDKDTVRKLVAIANDLRKIYPEVLPLPIAPRTLLHIAEHIARFPWDDPADIFMNTYNPSSIVEDPAIRPAIQRALEAHGLGRFGLVGRAAERKRLGRPDYDKVPADKPKPQSEQPPEDLTRGWADDSGDDWAFMGLGGRLPPMPFNSPSDSTKPQESPIDEAWAKVVEDVVRILTGYAPLRFVPFYYLEKHGERESNTPRRWRTLLGMEEIQYLPEDIDARDRNVSLGKAAHESWHVLFSHPEIIFDEPEMAKNMAFQALWWAIEDPRVNRLGLGRHPGSRKWVDAAYRKEYAVKDLEAERARWDAEIPLHLQFNYALIYEWWSGEPDPRVTDPRVLEALHEAESAIRRAYSAENAKRSFQIIKDEVWPIYKKLVDEAYQDAMDQESGQQGDGQQGEGQQGEGQEGEGQEGQAGQSGKQGKAGKGKKKELSAEEQKKLEDKVREKMEEKEKEFRDKHASKVVESPEKMSEAEKQKAAEEMKKLREKMSQAQKGQKGQKAQQGQKQDGQSSDGQSSQASDGKSQSKPSAKQKERLSKADEVHKDVTPKERDRYQEFLSRVRHLVPETRHQLQSVLAQKVRRRTIRNRRSGELDPDALHRIPAGARDIFKEELAPNKVLYRVSLLIDTSGSMSTEKKEAALEGAVMLVEALEKVAGIQYEIVKFDSDPKVLKAYNERLSPERKASLIKSILEGSGSTESHVALREAIERIRMGRGEKLIIMVNDGDPDNNFDRDQYRQMIENTRDVEVHGVGLGPSAQLVLDLFPPGRGWWLKDAAELAKKLRNILQKKILGR
ncbi:MAG: vWA domain-containing protein, partial [Elusimicrobiota bacterium]